MEKVDVLVLGAGTTGAYFARRIAERGFRVLVVDPKPEEKIGAKYDIFHVAAPDFARFGLPRPEKGEDLAFEFTGSRAFSAFGNYPKAGNGTVVGMHMHAYTLRMNRWAKEAGAEIRYETSFREFLWKNGKIVGARIENAKETAEVEAALVADCTGIPSVARTKLPDGYGVENFAIGPEDMFYVILRYVRYLEEKDYLKGSRSWTYYKTWEAPQADPHGAILGIGANLGFETAEKVYAEFEKAVPLPPHVLDHVEKGTTPYRRPPYSFVADGFAVLGDAACLTKPHAGEGVTSSMVQADLLAEAAGNLLKEKKPLTRENLWSVNKAYYSGQGKVYAGMLATLAGAVATNAKENEYFFRKDIIFSEKSFAAMGEDKSLTYSGAEMAAMALKMIWGILTFRLRLSTLGSLLHAMKDGDRITRLYADYPAEAGGFPAWEARAEAAWKEIPRMADVLRGEKA